MNMQTASEFVFSDKDFQMIADLANKKYGLLLQSSKKDLVYSRLARRLRALKLTNFKSYCDVLGHSDDQPEMSAFLSALTTNLTHFFREKHHFDFLQTDVIPTLYRRAEMGHPVRIWSAACSSGQEAYCIAASLLRAYPNAAKYDIKILATDVDPNIVSIARAGLYPNIQLSAIPQEYQHIMRGQSYDDSGNFRINDRLRALISFGCLNLVARWPMQRKFDVIFCRNTAIYFDKSTQTRLWSRFANALQPGGYLMIGHSERLDSASTHAFTSAGITTYRKCNKTSQKDE